MISQRPVYHFIFRNFKAYISVRVYFQDMIFAYCCLTFQCLVSDINDIDHDFSDHDLLYWSNVWTVRTSNDCISSKLSPPKSKNGRVDWTIMLKIVV